MPKLDKFISLNQAANISGYTQDYLGYLMRSGEIKGTKKGRAWFTTEEYVKDYLFKRKINKKQLAINDFLSLNRTKKNIIILTLFIFFSGLFIWSYLNKNDSGSNSAIIESAVISDGESINISK